MTHRFMKRFFIFILTITFFLGSLVFFFHDDFKNLLRNYLPFHTKSYVNSILLDREISYTKKDQAFNAMKDFFEVTDTPQLKKINNSEYFISNEVNIDLYKTNFLKKVKNLKAKGGSYLALLGNNLLIAQENGLFFFLPANFTESSHEPIQLKNIPSNLFSLIRYFDFYSTGSYGLKGMFADKNHLYISISYMKEPNCFNTSILRAEVSNIFLSFEEFFIPNQCVKINNKYGEFNASDSGGRISNFKTNKILFSTGTFRYRDLAQDPEGHLGKILSIDKDTSAAQVISLGHRNVMGLAYLSKSNEIWSTEHGPNGGDEINLNRLNIKTNPVNFGWPISSYGEHYGASAKNPEGALIVDLEHRVYSKAPLYKSHEDYGFKEPEIFFTPSIGISAIQGIDKNFINDSNYDLVFGSLGKTLDQYIPSERSLYLYNSEEKNLKKIFRGERIRDILYVQSSSRIIFSGETTGIIGVISRK